MALAASLRFCARLGSFAAAASAARWSALDITRPCTFVNRLT
jgi:hypothetical protein